MLIHFTKYQGTGNDFIMLDNLIGTYNDLTIENIQFLCDRKFGIGADGLIKLNSSKKFAFEMDYYNADGSKSFCGNGARSTLAFAEHLGISIDNVSFSAIDGIHFAYKEGDLHALNMLNVNEVELFQADLIINTGSPHYLKFVPNVLEVDVYNAGKKIRYSPHFNDLGINVNFVEVLTNNTLKVATYERGVEMETLSCGTGVTAAALSYAYKEKKTGKQIIEIQTKGGKLTVSFIQELLGVFTDIHLIGPAQMVFKGQIKC